MDMKMIPVVINASILTGSVARKTCVRGSLRSYSKLSRQAHCIPLVNAVIVILGFLGHVLEVNLELLLPYI